ncbi:saccharopine dehydrogenase-like oxidoreductase isoform X1 [Maniola hyperantus]|uniref:saccharopine dehydrogenase-like oxidoreductase isoform X1 n=2 Tax=Aphantopus hyperantus TaxID=2795564 RepID=UPI001568245D|nr:saccharopine dehydrogenase-like oxidoreductase [Maniola hyperantus]
MSPDRLDLVVFGASGYTGKHVVKELTRIAPKYPGLRWAVAGRNKERLETLLQDVTNKTGVNLSSTRIIVAAVEDEPSLRQMCSQTRLVLNCCGPFMKLGEPVVAMAIECGAHYVDVSGETLFVDVCERKYDQPARDARVYVVPTCGLSSVPADLGVIYLQQNFGGTLNSVEAYLVMHLPPKLLAERTKGVVRYSSWESMINSIAAMSLTSLHQKPLSPQLKPELKQRCLIHKNLNRWCLPFPTTDTDVVNKTQRYLLSSEKKRPVQYKAYISFPSVFTVIGILVAGALLFLLSKVSLLRKLLLDYPRLCSFGVVTHDDLVEGVMDDLLFQYEMLGEGWEKGSDVDSSPPNRKVVGRVSVSGADPAYVGTAVVVIFSALAILQESDKMPNRGGAITPGIAFRNTSLVKNLQENNINFEIVTKP